MQRLLTAHGVALDAHASKGAERRGACRSASDYGLVSSAHAHASHVSTAAGPDQCKQEGPVQRLPTARGVAQTQSPERCAAYLPL